MDAISLNTRLPYTFGNEIEYLHQLAAGLRPYSEVVMLGVGPAIMALALLEGNPTLKITGVDYYDLSGKSHIEEAFGSCMAFMNMLSIAAAPQWDDNTVDLLIVDANHSYEAVKADIQAWWPRVKAGGVVFFHDYIVHENDAPGNGVKQAVDEIEKEKYEILDTPGISIVIKKV